MQKIFFYATALLSFFSLEAEETYTSLDGMIVETGKSSKLGVKILDDGNFSSKIEHGSCIVDYYATWCQPCQLFAETFAKAAKEMQGSLKFYKVDIERSPKALGKASIQAIPTVILYREGQEVARHVGYLNRSALKEFILKNL